jgi:hypothetical protein
MVEYQQHTQDDVDNVQKDLDDIPARHLPELMFADIRCGRCSQISDVADVALKKKKKLEHPI